MPESAKAAPSIGHHTRGLAAERAIEEKTDSPVAALAALLLVAVAVADP